MREDTEKSSQCEGESKAVRMFNWNENRILLTGRQGQPEEAVIHSAAVIKIPFLPWPLNE